MFSVIFAAKAQFIGYVATIHCFVATSFMTEKLTVLITAFFYIVFLGERALSEPLGHSPRICIGYYSYENDNGSWRNSETYLCPKNFAAFAANLSGSSSLSAAQRIIAVSCCPLPSEDILLDEHVEVDSECPENHVVTGAIKHVAGSGLARKMRCTKVNTKRYGFTERQLGIFSGSGTHYWREKSKVYPGELPASIRYGIGRRGKYNWYGNSCVSDPLGSLLVGKSTKRCSGLTFRGLVFNGLPGDPPKGAAVKMFPDCTSISSRFDPEARCQ